MGAIYSSPQCRRTYMKHASKYHKNNVRKRVIGGDSISTSLKDDAEYPIFANLLRQLYRRAHPDILRSANPEYAQINDSSMQLLNGILSTIKQYNEYPSQIIKTIPFYMKSSDGTLRLVNLSIRTAGGDCRRSMMSSFESFFIDAEILQRNNAFFVWGKEYFPTEPLTNDEECQ